MRILERYILKSVASTFLLCLTVFVSLYVIIDLFSNLGDILTQNSNFQIIVRYYLSYLPIIFTQVSPICCLLATLYAFGRLNRDNEIIAMRSAGLSVMQIAKTVIIFGGNHLFIGRTKKWKCIHGIVFWHYFLSPCCARPPMTKA